ncbi:hypothetical protein JCM11641_003076 [Rhodosporidiobolus odoratus]
MACTATYSRRLLALSAPCQGRSFFNFPFSSTSSSSSPPPERRGTLTKQNGVWIYSENKVMPYSSAQLCSVIADVDSYTQFLPFTSTSRVLSATQISPRDGRRTPQSLTEKGWLRPGEGERWEMDAELRIGAMGFDEGYVSLVELETAKWVKATAKDASMFRHLSTLWSFTPQPFATPARPQTLVELSLAYRFTSPLHAAAISTVWDKVSALMVKKFEERVEQKQATTMETSITAISPSSASAASPHLYHSPPAFPPHSAPITLTTPQPPKLLKLTHLSITRLLPLSSAEPPFTAAAPPSWTVLSADIQRLFSLEKAPSAVEWQDHEGDFVRCSSDAELAFVLAAREGDARTVKLRVVADIAASSPLSKADGLTWAMDGRTTAAQPVRVADRDVLGESTNASEAGRTYIKTKTEGFGRRLLRKLSGNASSRPMLVVDENDPVPDPTRSPSLLTRSSSIFTLATIRSRSQDRSSVMSPLEHAGPLLPRTRTPPPLEDPDSQETLSAGVQQVNAVYGIGGGAGVTHRLRRSGSTSTTTILGLFTSSLSAPSSPTLGSTSPSTPSSASSGESPPAYTEVLRMKESQRMLEQEEIRGRAVRTRGGASSRSRSRGMGRLMQVV